MRITFYLFKKEVSEYTDALLIEKLAGDERYEEVTPQELSTKFDYKIFLQRNVSKPPKWLEFIGRFASIQDKDQLKNQVNSFVILIKRQDRIFALTGGFGFHALNIEKTESNFGLIVALNSIDEEEVKFIDVKNIDTNTKQKRVITSLNSPIREFDLDFNKELLRIISGAPIDSTLANSIKGSGSLMLSAKIKFEELGEKCEQLLLLYQDQRYKESYGFINNILPIKDGVLENELDSILVEKFQARTEDEKINITYPDQFEYEKCDTIKVFGLRNEPVNVEDLTLCDVYRFFENTESIDIDTIKKQVRVIGLDSEDNAVTSEVPLYNFFSFETTFRNILYVLSNKQWFRVDKDYISDVESQLNSIEYIENYLPNYHHGSEGEYNQDVCNSDPRFVLFDKKNIKPTLGGKVEACDLLQISDKADFIHVKKDYASSSLSHLFAQGSVSLELLISDSVFKQNFERELGVAFTKKSQDIVVSYGIISRKQGNLVSKLPVFSKIHLLTHINRIRMFQAKPRIIKISRIN